jgi:hypothetical protein
MKHHFWLLVFGTICVTALADTIPEPGLASPAYIPPPPAPVVATYSQPTQTIYYNQPAQTVYYNQPVVHTQQVRSAPIDRYAQYRMEQEQVFGKSWLWR